MLPSFLFLLFAAGKSATPAPIPQRVDTLVAKMTLDEKVAMLWAVQSHTLPPSTLKTGVGWLKHPGAHPTIGEIIATRNQMQQNLIKTSRLHIPATFFQECLHSAVPGATVFPMPVTQGNSWNVSLVESIAKVIALEARVSGVDVAFSPVLNMWTDARFGRQQEGFSENPTLTAHYARAALRGFQNDNGAGSQTYLKNTSVISVGKHYAGYGAALGGLNAAPSDISPRTFFDIYLKPWRAFGRQGGRGAMASHQTFNHVPLHANSYLLNDVFRSQYNFSGMIVSDCNDIGVLMDYRLASNLTQAAALGLRGGVDLDLICGGSSVAGSYEHLAEAVKLGYVSEKQIEVSTRRVLSGKFAVSNFDSPYTDVNAWKTIVGIPAHRRLAYEAATQGIVCLKGKYLNPSSIKKIAVVGPNGGCLKPSSTSLCDAQMNMLGPYTQESKTLSVPTVADAFASRFSNKIVAYERGVEIDDSNTNDIAAAVKLANESDIVVAVLGDSLHTCGEWNDRDSLELSGEQGVLLQALTKVCKDNNKPLVVVLIHGRQQTFGPKNEMLNDIDMLLVTYRPGEEGGNAIADIIMGNAEATGRLGQNWPANVGQIRSGASPWLQEVRGKWVANSRGKQVDPDGRHYDNYIDDDGYPLFWFGQGISSYGVSFAFSIASVRVVNNRPRHPTDTVMTVEVDVKNMGSRGATTVVQVYLVDPQMFNLVMVRYWKRLVGFQKVFVGGGQNARVSVSVNFDDVGIFVDEANTKYEIVPGEYEVRVGGDSRSDKATAKVRL